MHVSVWECLRSSSVRLCVCVVSKIPIHCPRGIFIHLITSTRTCGKSHLLCCRGMRRVFCYCSLETLAALPEHIMDARQRAPPPALTLLWDSEGFPMMSTVHFFNHLPTYTEVRRLRLCLPACHSACAVDPERHFVQDGFCGFLDPPPPPFSPGFPAARPPQQHHFTCTT